MMPSDLKDAPEFGAPDAALFAPLTIDENILLNQHLVSGWYKQGHVYPALSDIWRETSEVLDDMHAACKLAQDARRRARAERIGGAL